MPDKPSDFDILDIFEYQEYLTKYENTKTCLMCGNDKVNPMIGECVELWIKRNDFSGRLPVLTYACEKCGYIMLLHLLKSDIDKYQKSKK